MLQVALARCRNLGPLAFSCGPNELDPFAATVVAHQQGYCTRYEESPLAAFFELWQPASKAELVGLDVEGASAALQQHPRGDTPPLPWSASSTGANAAGRLQHHQLQTVAGRLGVHEDELFGSIYQGPVSSAFGAVTYERLVAIAASIRREGFCPGKRSRPHLDGRILRHGPEHRVLIVSGKHRTAALSALGYTTVPLRFGPHKMPMVVDRRDAPTWPNVANGIYDLAQALDLFDRVFAGEQPPGCPAAT